MQDLNDNSRTATLETTCLLPKVTTKRHRPYTSTPPQPQGPTPTRAWSPLESSPSKPSCPTSEEASGEPHVLFDNAMQSFSSSSCSGTSSVIAEDLNAVETPAGRTITSERELKRSLPASGCVRKFMLDLIPELILQNSGSVARDHLASERTFLAYVRTSVTIASAGIGKYHFHSHSATLCETGQGTLNYGSPLLYSPASVNQYADIIGSLL